MTSFWGDELNMTMFQGLNIVWKWCWYKFNHHLGRVFCCTFSNHPSGFSSPLATSFGCCRLAPRLNDTSWRSWANPRSLSNVVVFCAAIFVAFDFFFFGKTGYTLGVFSSFQHEPLTTSHDEKSRFGETSYLNLDLPAIGSSSSGLAPTKVWRFNQGPSCPWSV